MSLIHFSEFTTIQCLYYRQYYFHVKIGFCYQRIYLHIIISEDYRCKQKIIIYSRCSYIGFNNLYLNIQLNGYLICRYTI